MPLSIYLSLSTFSLSFSLSLFSRLLRGETISHGGRALSAACAKCGRNSNPLVPFVLPARGRSTSYNQPAVACRAAKREATAPYRKLYRCALYEQIDFFSQFSSNERAIRKSTNEQISSLNKRNF